VRGRAAQVLAYATTAGGSQVRVVVVAFDRCDDVLLTATFDSP
jgi:hypothetical protein